MIADAATAVLAVARVFCALATVRHRRWLPDRLVRWTLWPLATLMVLRALTAAIGDVQQLATGTSTRTTVLDLALWSPLFLVLGLLWAATALTYTLRTEGTTAGPSATGTARRAVSARAESRHR